MVRTDETAPGTVPERGWRGLRARWRRARYPYRIVAVLAVEVLAVLACGAIAWTAVPRLADSCWLGLAAPPPIVLAQRYLVKDGKSVAFPRGDYHQLTAGASDIGVRLALKRTCYCRDLVGRVVPQQLSDNTWVLAALADLQLAPVGSDTSTLEGEWMPLPRGQRYRMELQVMCASNPDKVLLRDTIGTFTEE